MCNIVFAYNILMILYLSAASEEFLELTRSALLAALEGLQLLIQNDILISLLYELCLRSVDFSFIFFPLLQLFRLVRSLGLQLSAIK